MSSLQFYTDQAATCARSADGAALANERDKYLRAEAAWQALASREDSIRAVREKREAERAALLLHETEALAELVGR